MDKMQKPDEVPQSLESARELLEQVDGLMRRNRKAGTQPVAPPPSSSPLPPPLTVKPPIAEQSDETEFAVDENLTLSAEIDAELAAELARSSMRLGGRYFFEEPQPQDHGRSHSDVTAVPHGTSVQHETTSLQEPEWAAEHYLQSDELTSYPLNVRANAAENSSDAPEVPSFVIEGSADIARLSEIDAEAFESASAPISSSDLLQQEAVTFLSLHEMSAAPSHDSAPYITAMPTAMSSEVKGFQNDATAPIEEPPVLLNEEAIVAHSASDRFAIESVPELSDVVDVNATEIQAPFVDIVAGGILYSDDLGGTVDAVSVDTATTYKETLREIDDGSEHASLTHTETALSDDSDACMLSLQSGTKKKTYESVLETLGMATAVPHGTSDHVLPLGGTIVPTPFDADIAEPPVGGSIKIASDDERRLAVRVDAPEEISPVIDRVPAFATEAARAQDINALDGYENKAARVYAKVSALPPLRYSAAVFLDEVLSGGAPLLLRAISAVSQNHHVEAPIPGVEGDSESPSIQRAVASRATASSHPADNDWRQPLSGDVAETTLTLAPLSERVWSGNVAPLADQVSQKPLTGSRMKATEDLPEIPKTSAAALLDKEDYYPLLTDVVTESRLSSSP